MTPAPPRILAKERLLLERGRALVYREPPAGPPLRLHLFLPEGLEAAPDRSVLAFFHGGAWDGGKAVQFAPQALHFAARGAVCALAEYRTSASHPGASAPEAHADCRAALAFLRGRTAELPFEAAKLVALGAGAGANLAACAALGVPLSVLGAPCPEEGPAGVPEAAVLFSAVFEPEREPSIRDRFPNLSAARASSLPRRARGGSPPMLLLHGTEDRLVPFAQAEGFAEAMARKGSPVELAAFEGRDRDFFNFSTDPQSFEAALESVDAFLVRHGFLRAPGEGESCRVVSRREDDF